VEGLGPEPKKKDEKLWKKPVAELLWLEDVEVMTWLELDVI